MVIQHQRRVRYYYQSSYYLKHKNQPQVFGGTIDPTSWLAMVECSKELKTTPPTFQEATQAQTQTHLVGNGQDDSSIPHRLMPFNEPNPSAVIRINSHYPRKIGMAIAHHEQTKLQPFNFYG
jgi:hypothetical protein